MTSISKTTLFWTLFGLIIGLIVVGVFVFSVRGNSSTGQNSQLKLLVPVSASDHTIGTSTAPVVIVEYADFECPACQQYAPVLNQLLKDESGKILFVYRYFPLPQHTNAIPAAKAAEAAGLQGKFWEMHDLLFSNYTSWENLPDPHDVFLQYAQTLGLDTGKFTKDEASQAVADRISADYADAGRNKLTYTPTLFVNGVRIDNPQNYTDFKKLVEDAAGSTLH